MRGVTVKQKVDCKLPFLKTQCTVVLVFSCNKTPEIREPTKSAEVLLNILLAGKSKVKVGCLVRAH